MTQTDYEVNGGGRAQIRFLFFFFAYSVDNEIVMKVSGKAKQQ